MHHTSSVSTTAEEEKGYPEKKMKSLFAKFFVKHISYWCSGRHCMSFEKFFSEILFWKIYFEIHFIRFANFIPETMF